MRGIKFNLNRYEFEVVRDELFKSVNFHCINSNGLKVIALRNVLKKFQKKVDRKQKRERGELANLS